jgi:hypothetical protein
MTAHRVVQHIMTDGRSDLAHPVDAVLLGNTNVETTQKRVAAVHHFAPWCRRVHVASSSALFSDPALHSWRQTDFSVWKTQSRQVLFQVDDLLEYSLKSNILSECFVILPAAYNFSNPAFPWQFFIRGVPVLHAGDGHYATTRNLLNEMAYYPHLGSGSDRVAISRTQTILNQSRHIFYNNQDRCLTDSVITRAAPREQGEKQEVYTSAASTNLCLIYDSKHDLRFSTAFTDRYPASSTVWVKISLKSTSPKNRLGFIHRQKWAKQPYIEITKWDTVEAMTAVVVRAAQSLELRVTGIQSYSVATSQRPGASKLSKHKMATSRQLSARLAQVFDCTFNNLIRLPDHQH